MSYNLLRPVHIIVAQSMVSTITSNPVEVRNQDNVGIQMNCVGTPTGSFDVQISMDYQVDLEGNVINAGNWVSLGITPAPSVSGASDSLYIDLNQLSAPYIRIVYTATGGTGTLDVFMTAKGV